MKYLILLIFILIDNISVARTVVRTVDTLMIINTHHPRGKRLKVVIGNIEFQLSKSKHLKNWQERNDMELYNYVKKQRKLILRETDFVNINELSPLYRAISYFDEKMCEIIESGSIKIIKDGIKQKAIIKVHISESDQYSSTHSNKFILKNGDELWQCFPIYHDDFTPNY